jgi:hypothetical protein
MPKKKSKIAPAKTLVLVNNLGLSESEMAASVALAKAVPNVVKSYQEFKDAQGAFVSRFWRFVHELRQPVSLMAADGKTPLPPVKLNGREITLLVRGLGEPAPRASEFKVMAEMSEDLYQRAVALSLPRVDALKVARGTLEIQEGEDGESQLVPSAKAKKVNPVTPTKAEYHKAPAEFRNEMQALIAKYSELKSFGDDVPYEFSGATSDGREYAVRIFIDQAPQKAK